MLAEVVFVGLSTTLVHAILYRHPLSLEDELYSLGSAFTKLLTVHIPSDIQPLATSLILAQGTGMLEGANHCVLINLPVVFS